MPISLEIVSPEKLLLSRSVDMVVIPASEGDMGVLEGHSPMIVMLRGGAIALYENDQIVEQYFVSSGFAEVTGESCNVLAQEALPIAALSKDEGERRLAEAEAELSRLQEDDVQQQLLALDRVQSAQALIEAAETLLTGSH